MAPSCAIDKCDSAVFGRGWCSRHYNIWRRFDDPLAPTRRYEAAPDECQVDDCGRAPAGRGYCLKHYKALRRHGTPTPRYRGVVVDGNRVCARCERDVPVGTVRNCLCPECWGEQNRARQHERRVLSTNPDGTREKFTRKEVLERDGYVCRVCLDPIDPAIAYPHPLSPSLDHVIPLSRGGDHSMANTQAAHLTCNQHKWATMPADFVAVMARG